ncbi:hypothetical protein GWK47_045827 [Chionoecetes opilio]|uniref:Uncharacterized protein n=1 Tax=Chionoecetes opilio TaxID=41210 RepID=A0A8J4Y7U0_CHIOP|nr:hypothetical protein GWK47_045827 [Chionoecetes opilio]
MSSALWHKVVATTTDTAPTMWLPFKDTSVWGICLWRRGGADPEVVVGQPANLHAQLEEVAPAVVICPSPTRCGYCTPLTYSPNTPCPDASCGRVEPGLRSPFTKLPQRPRGRGTMQNPLALWVANSIKEKTGRKLRPIAPDQAADNQGTVSSEVKAIVGTKEEEQPEERKDRRTVPSCSPVPQSHEVRRQKRWRRTTSRPWRTGKEDVEHPPQSQPVSLTLYMRCLAGPFQEVNTPLPSSGAVEKAVQASAGDITLRPTRSSLTHKLLSSWCL